jgi:two-component system phosphate regulon sensor histidine kinase PhoR
MIAELAHEFRAPLSMILTAAQLFQRPKITEEQRAQMAEMIIKEAQRLSELTTAHLELARMESGRVQFHFEEVRLQAVLAEELIMMSSKAQEKGIELFLNVPDDLPSLEADPNRLKQVVINLLSNAIKYTPPQGWVKLSAWAKPGEMIFTVADTGVGIPAESLPKIFEKFFRVPESKKMAEGNGLGLSICQRIIEAHGGRIDVDSDEGVGTTFTVTLPLNR